MLKNLWSGLIDLVFPRNCLICRRYAPQTAVDPLCPACHQSLPYNFPPFCQRCSRHLTDDLQNLFCADCQRHPPSFDMAWGFTLYTGTMRTLIPSFKFHNKTALRHTFTTIAKTFLDKYSVDLSAFDALIPLPLSATRLRERGYNQAVILAEALSGLLNKPCLNKTLLRARHTPRQSDLGSKERWTNITGAFKMEPSSDIKGRNILLVDDLLTTGATASEAARVLKEAGANNVGVIVLSIA